MRVGLEKRLLRIEGRRGPAAELNQLPDGMVTVLLWGVAVHLGGFPAPAQPKTRMEKDDVFTAVDRALGYLDASEPGLRCGSRDNEWVERFAAAVARLCLLIGLSDENTPVRDEATLVAFGGMLDRIAEAHPEFGSSSAWPRLHPWPNVDVDMDAWITAVGHSPAAIRALARATVPSVFQTKNAEINEFMSAKQGEACADRYLGE